MWLSPSVALLHCQVWCTWTKWHLGKQRTHATQMGPSPWRHCTGHLPDPWWAILHWVYPHAIHWCQTCPDGRTFCPWNLPLQGRVEHMAPTPHSWQHQCAIHWMVDTSVHTLEGDGMLGRDVWMWRRYHHQNICNVGWNQWGEFYQQHFLPGPGDGYMWWGGTASNADKDDVLRGNFIFDRTPLTPPGTKAIVYDDHDKHTSWDEHDSDAWYTG